MTTVHVLMIALALAAAPAAALRSRRASSVAAVRAPHLLHALRGGATKDADDGFLWVRNGDGPVQLVHSLSAFCEEHKLDEEAMLAVSRGDTDEHEGWTCGVPQMFDKQPAKKVAVKAAEAVEDAKPFSAVANRREE